MNIRNLVDHRRNRNIKEERLEYKRKEAIRQEGEKGLYEKRKDKVDEVEKNNKN